MMAVADNFIPTFEFLQVKELNLTGLPLGQQMFRLTEMITGELVVDVAFLLWPKRMNWQGCLKNGLY